MLWLQWRSVRCLPRPVVSGHR